MASGNDDKKLRKEKASINSDQKSQENGYGIGDEK